jgi:hypothetical protein
LTPKYETTIIRIVPHNGTKSIAVDPDVHQRAKLAATASGESLMEFTEKALEAAMPPAFRKPVSVKKKGDPK